MVETDQYQTSLGTYRRQSGRYQYQISLGTCRHRYGGNRPVPNITWYLSVWWKPISTKHRLVRISVGMVETDQYQHHLVYISIGMVETDQYQTSLGTYLRRSGGQTSTKHHLVLISVGLVETDQYQTSLETLLPSVWLKQRSTRHQFVSYRHQSARGREISTIAANNLTAP
jgi:hypothetical protein